MSASFIFSDHSSNASVSSHMTIKMFKAYLIQFLNMLFIGISILFVPTLADAQRNPSKLTGTVIDQETQEPLGYVTVSVVSLPDSTLQGGGLTDMKGKFSVEVAPGEYTIQFDYMGYVDLSVPINVTSSSKDMGNISLKESTVTLQEVEVVGQRSQVELKLDKRVFNVGEDLTTIGSTAADVLNSVPSVTVDPEGVVRLRGSQGVRVLVDGKPSALISAGDIDALRRLQSDIIESIEVITNPSARYEAEGEAGIINIILKKNQKRGLNGSFGLTAGYPTNLAASYSLNYRQSNLNFFSNFGINYQKQPGGGSASQAFFDEGIQTELYTSETDQLRGGIGVDLQLGTDWFINDRNTLTGSLLLRRSKQDNTATVIFNDLDQNMNLTNRTVRDSEEDSDSDNIEGALSYKRAFSQPDREWTVDFKYILDDDLELTEYEQTSWQEEDPLLQRSSNTEYETNILIQSDYIHPLSDSSKLEFGYRTALRTIKNDFSVEQLENGEYVIFDDFDDELTYTENIHAAYFIYSREWGKVGFQGGLRGEYSLVKADLLKSTNDSDQEYFNLFPSAAFSYKFSSTRQFQVSYSRRLSRPFFRLLLPFSNFNDSRNILIGNPTLRPEYTDSYEIGILNNLTKGSILASVYYRRTTGVIERLILPGEEEGTTIRFPVNLSQRNAYGVELNFSYDLTSWWKVDSDVNLYRAFVEGEYEETEYDTEIFAWSGQVRSTMNIWKKVDFQASFNYNAPENTPQGRLLSRYSLDLGAAVDVFAGKGTITLSGRDLFNTQKERRTTNLPDYQAESVFQWRQTRQVVLNFSYRLNQSKPKQAPLDTGQDGDF